MKNIPLYSKQIPYYLLFTLIFFFTFNTNLYSQTGALASIEISPADCTLEIGQSEVFTVTGKDILGNRVTLVSPVVVGTGGTSTIYNAPNVSLTGVIFTAGAETGNNFSIEVFDVSVTGAPGTPDAIWGSINITVESVSPPALEHIEITPPDVTLEPGQVQTFTANGIDQHGNNYNEFTPVWVCSDGTIAENGQFTAGTQIGEVTVSCTTPEAIASGNASVHIVGDTPRLVSIIVTPLVVTLRPGETQQFKATGTNQFGNMQTVTQPEWSATSGTIDTEGLFRAGEGAPDSATVAAQIPEPAVFAEAQAHIRALEAEIAEIKVSPETANVEPGGTQQFEAEGTNQYGYKQEVENPKWFANGGTISDGGLFTAEEEGPDTNSVGCIQPSSSVMGTATVTATATGIEIINELPTHYTLSQNYPNPFNPSTSIKFRLAESGKTSLKIYDQLGREIASLINEYKHAGDYHVSFNGMNLSSGVYFYRIVSGKYIETKKMLMIK